MAVDPDEFALFIPYIAEFGCEENFRAAVFDCLTDKAFVLAAAVHIGGIGKGEPQVEGPVDGGNGFRIVLRTVELGHAHTAEAESSNLRTVFAEHSCLHRR